MLHHDPHVRLKKPILIAAWPGMGQVAMKVVRHLKDALKARIFAELEPENYFYHTDVRVDNGIVTLPDLPHGKFYYWKNDEGEHDLVFFISDLQPPPEHSFVYAEKILNFVGSLNVKQVITCAALLTTVDYMVRPQVFFQHLQDGQGSAGIVHLGCEKRDLA